MSSHGAHHYDDPATPRHCQNCAAKLSGPYCSVCGQHDIEYHRSFYHLAEDVVENLFHFDGKFLVSVAWLLSKPGRLTTEFNSGRRASQVPPLRFYIFVTVLFFLGLQLLHHGHIFDYDRREVDRESEKVTKSLGEKKKNALSFQSLSEEQRKAMAQEISQAATQKQGAEKTAAIKDIIARYQAEAQASAAAVRAATTAAKDETAPAAGVAAKSAVKPGVHTKVDFDETSDLGVRLKEKITSGELSASKFLDELEHRVPSLLFLGMPVFALLLKAVYFRRHRYYIEHLVFSLHLHTWAFLAAMVGGGWIKLASLVSAGLGTAFGWAFAFWIPWYVVAAFRHVYGQSWIKTTFKVGLVATIYSVLLVAMTMLIIFYTVVVLAWE